MRHDPEFIGLVELARRLRRNQTPAEQVLWELLRSRRFLGLKFRRQHRIGQFIVDFFCREQKLVIELDGEVHSTSEQAAKDDNRDAYLRQLSNKVLRFSNHDLDQPESLLERIAKNCKGLPPYRGNGRGEAPPLPGERERMGEGDGG